MGLAPASKVALGDVSLCKPSRGGRTGTSAFGSLGPAVDATRYEEQFVEKAATVKQTLSAAVSRRALDSMEAFRSPATAHRHRAGPFAVRPASEDGERAAVLELTMWDPQARAPSIMRATEVPMFSRVITFAMEALRLQPIQLDEALRGDAPLTRAHLPGWGQTIGRGLRSVQLHSSTTDELLITLAYHDERRRCLKRGETFAGEDALADEWTGAARILRDALLAALHQGAAGSGGAAGSTPPPAPRVDIVGRWKRRCLSVERDFIWERFALADGRTLVYKQPEGQFSNPNAACEVFCLDWLCRMAQAIRADCCSGPARLLELHCGGGNNTVAVSAFFDEVIAVEINRVLAEVAEENLAANGVSSVRMVRSPSALAVGGLRTSLAGSAQAVLVDPPRSGLDAETLALVAEFEHVLYISCNPDALARDLRLLSGHEAGATAFFDMFPYTSHSECAVYLKRKAPGWAPMVIGAVGGWPTLLCRAAPGGSFSFQRAGVPPRRILVSVAIAIAVTATAWSWSRRRQFDAHWQRLVAGRVCVRQT